MNRNTLVMETIRNTATSQLEQYGTVDLALLISSITNDYEFDVDTAREAEMARVCRSVLSTFRDKEGIRTVLATGRSGEFIDIEKCTDKEKVDMVVKRLENQIDGITRTLKKLKPEIDGQMSIGEMQYEQDALCIGG